MSDKWEIVGRRKDKPNKMSNLKSTSGNPDNITDSANKLAPKQASKQQLPTTPKIPTRETTAKKVQKHKSSPGAADKVKPPKSIDVAFSNIPIGDLQNLFDTCRTKFATTPIVWLKEIMQFLNHKVAVKSVHPTFQNHPVDYPLRGLPLEVKNILAKAVREAGPENIACFYDIALTSMATEVAKGCPVVGHRVMLQYISKNNPRIIFNNIDKYVSLRNSYQNQAPVGLSIMWAFAQPGYRDLQVGLKVYQQLMCSLSEQKTYRTFVLDYLSKIFERACDKDYILKDQLFCIADIMFKTPKRPDETNYFKYLLPQLSKRLFAGVKQRQDTVGSIAEALFKKLLILTDNQKHYQEYICTCLLDCFHKDPRILDNQWRLKHARKVSTVNHCLITYIDKLPQLSLLTSYGDSFKNVISTLHSTYMALPVKKQKEEQILQTIRSIKSLQKKLTVMGTEEEYHSFGSTMKRTLFFLLLVSVISIYADIKQHGSWKHSQTNKFFQDSGIAASCQQITNHFFTIVNWADQNIETHWPSYKTHIEEFSLPYIKLAKDFTTVVWNSVCSLSEYIVRKWPIIVKEVEQRIPGVVEQCQAAVAYVSRNVKQFYWSCFTYLQNEVFVGNLSPENMQKVLYDVYNATHTKATEYFVWMSEKVERTLK